MIIINKIKIQFIKKNIMINIKIITKLFKIFKIRKIKCLFKIYKLIIKQNLIKQTPLKKNWYKIMNRINFRKNKT